MPAQQSQYTHAFETYHILFPIITRSSHELCSSSVSDTQGVVKKNIDYDSTHRRTHLLLKANDAEWPYSSFILTRPV